MAERYNASGTTQRVMPTIPGNPRKVLFLRMYTSEWQAIKTAANASGKSMNLFCLEALLTAAAGVVEEPPNG